MFEIRKQMNVIKKEFKKFAKGNNQSLVGLLVFLGADKVKDILVSCTLVNNRLKPHEELLMINHIAKAMIERYETRLDDNQTQALRDTRRYFSEQYMIESNLINNSDLIKEEGLI